MDKVLEIRYSNYFNTKDPKDTTKGAKDITKGTKDTMKGTKVLKYYSFDSIFQM